MGLNRQRMTGGCGEAIVVAEFLKRGVPVYQPVVDIGADLVVDFNGKLQRVQVKSSVDDRKKVCFHLGRRNPDRSGGHCWLSYEDGELDWYAICCLGHGYTALIPAKCAGLSLTFDGQELSQRLKDMEIGTVIDQILEGNE